METIQGLRRRAAAAGNLGPSEEMRIVREGAHILIEPASPQVVYVPYYDPAVVYGPWWWPAYQPVYWAPWAGYYVRTAYAPAFIWGSGVVIRTGFFFGHFNWPHRQVIVVHPQPARVVVKRQVTVIHRAPVARDRKPVRWQHDPRRRQGAPYRHAEKRDSRLAQPKTTGNARRPDGIGNTLRLRSRSTPRAPTLRTDARRAAAARNRHGRQAQGARPAPTPATRSAGDRRDGGRPAATVRKIAPVARPSASRGSSALRVADGRHRAKVLQGDVAARRSASAEKKPVTGRQGGLRGQTTNHTKRTNNKLNRRDAERSRIELEPPRRQGRQEKKLHRRGRRGREGK